MDNNSMGIFGFICHYLFAQFESNNNGIFEEVSMKEGIYRFGQKVVENLMKKSSLEDLSLFEAVNASKLTKSQRSK